MAVLAVANDIANEFATGILARLHRLAGRHHRTRPRFDPRRRTAAHGLTPACPTAAGLAMSAKLPRGARKVNAPSFIAFRHQPDEHRLLQASKPAILRRRKSAVDDASERHYLADNPARVAPTSCHTPGHKTTHGFPARW